MSDKNASSTDRRSFLKTGALAAAPVAAFAAPAALASDGNGERLARLEDERAIESLTRAFLRRFNRKGARDCGEFVAAAGAVDLAPGTRAIEPDPAADPQLSIAADGTASLRRRCFAETQRDFDGNTTLEQMARLQGQGSHRQREARMLEARFSRTAESWTIAHLRLT